MSNVLLVCASPRPNSSSSKVTNYLKSRIAAKGHTVEDVSFVGLQMRSIGEGYIQPAEVTPDQQHILDALAKAQIVIWVIPEYNRGTPAEFIAFLEHFGAKPYSFIWNDKVHAPVGVSSGIGGREPIYHLAKAFNYMIDSLSGKNCYVSPFYFQSINTGDQFDEQGSFSGDERYAQNAEKFVTNLLG